MCEIGQACPANTLKARPRGRLTMAELPGMSLVATSPGTLRVLSDLKLWQCTPLCLPQTNTAMFNSARPALSAASGAQKHYFEQQNVREQLNRLCRDTCLVRKESTFRWLC